MEMVKKTNGNKLADYKMLVKQFNGEDFINYETSMEISESEVTALFFGILVKTAGEHYQKDFKQTLNYEQIFQRFVKRVSWKRAPQSPPKMVIDFPKSLALLDFVRIAETYLNEKEKQAMALLLLHEFENNVDREQLEVPFLVGLFGNFKFE